MADVDTLKAEVKKLNAKATQAKMDLHDLSEELLLEGHHQLDRVQAVGAEIVDEAGPLRHLRFVDTEVLDDDLLHPVGDVTHCSDPYELRRSV